MSLLDKFLTRQPSRNDFADLITQALLNAGVVNIHYNQADYSLKIGEGGKNALFLSNSYTDYCKAPRSQRRAVIARMTAAIVSVPTIPADFASVQQNLIPLVRDAASFELADLQFQARGMDASKLRCPTRAVVDNLAVSLAYDTEHSIMQVSHETFNAWGVSFEQALKQAKDNLRDRTDPKGIAEYAPGVFLGQWGDSNESARMLLPDLLYRLSVYGDPVAFVPNRAQLWVTGKNNAEGVGAILKMGEPSCFEPYSVSSSLYLLNDGVWETYLPEDPAQRALCLSIQRRREGMNYNEQKQSLDLIHKRDHVDVFAASYSIQTRKDGSTQSICVWANGVESLLPKTEFIALLVDQDAKDFVFVTWETAMSLVRDLVEVEPDLVPTRYRVRSFPSHQQIAHLRAVAQ